MADRFNQTVAMDLKEYKHHKTWILHLIDCATRYSVACLIPTKRKETVVQRIFQIWIAYCGCPKKFHSDNGGEFANEVFREMCDKLGVEVSTTPAESPFSNGVVERHNAVLYEAMCKTIEDVKCDPETGLAWALASKNALLNKGGYSPNQLVFGHNGNLPSVVTDLPPALESSTSSDIVKENLQAIHAARTNYIKAESNEKIRRALRHNVRTYSEEIFEVGNKVFYKRQAFKGWRGPATVVGIDGKFILIRYGSQFYRCHQCHLMKVTKTSSSNTIDASRSILKNNPGQSKQKKHVKIK